MEMKLKMIRGFKKMDCPRNLLKPAIMQYGFSLFLSSRNGNSGKSPLMLAGINMSETDWTTYSRENISTRWNSPGMHAYGKRGKGWHCLS